MSFMLNHFILFGTSGSIGAVTGNGTGAAVGAATAETIGAASAIATAAATGISTAEAVGSATGTATAAADSGGTTDGDGAATATGSALAVGESTAASDGAATATGTAAGVGSSTAASTGAATGAGTGAATGLPVDASFSSVELLVHFTGSNGSTIFDDESTDNRTLTASGNAQIQSNKLELDGTGDFVTAPDSADWELTADFTIELFDVEFDAVNVLQELVGHWNATGNQRGWILGFDGTTNTLRISVSTAGTAGTVTNNTWSWTPSAAPTAYDICVERSGSTLRAYVDGVLLASNITYSGASFNSNQVLGIGVRGGSADELDGRMKALRFTKGVARYANDGGYTVPPLPLPAA